MRTDLIRDSPGRFLGARFLLGISRRVPAYTSLQSPPAGDCGRLHLDTNRSNPKHPETTSLLFNFDGTVQSGLGIHARPSSAFGCCLKHGATSYKGQTRPASEAGDQLRRSVWRARSSTWVRLGSKRLVGNEGQIAGWLLSSDWIEPRGTMPSTRRAARGGRIISPAGAALCRWDKALHSAVIQAQIGFLPAIR